MSIVSEITRIKENIANAYDEAEGRGAALPEVRNSANLAGTIAGIPQGEEQWKPEVDWWDIDSILENDTEDYRGKMICLMNDYEDVTVLPESYGSIMRAAKIKTSDGSEYTNLSAGVRHVWDKSKDKDCSLGYKTRYMIFYWSGETTFGTWSFENIRNTIYLICENLTMSTSNTGYQFASLPICECVKFKSCTYVANYLRLDNGCFKKIVIRDSAFPNISSLARFMSNRFLSDREINEIYNVVSTGNEENYQESFYNCIKLKSIDLKDTSGVSNFSNAFFGCCELESVNNIDLSSAVNTNGLFFDCYSLRTIGGNLDTAKVVNASSMFNRCSSMMRFGDFDLGSVTSMYHMFEGCYNLIEVGDLSTPNCENMNNLFSVCYFLKRIGGIDFDCCKDVGSMFNRCISLESIDRIANIKISGLDFSACVLLDHDTLIRVLNALYDYSTDGESTHTIRFGGENLAKLTDEELAIGQDKGWTIS